MASKVQALTGWSVSSPISKMAKPSWSRRTACGARNQRPRSTAPQTQDQPDHSWRNAGQHVRRISLARIVGARFRGGCRERRDGRAKAPRVGLRLSGGAHQLRVSRARGLDNGPSRQGDGAWSNVARHQSSSFSVGIRSRVSAKRETPLSHRHDSP